MRPIDAWWSPMTSFSSGNAVVANAKPSNRALSPLLQQGVLFLEAGDAAGAELLLDTYLRRTPDDADGHNLAALAKHGLDRLDDAVRHMERARELAPRDPTFAVNLSVMLAGAGRGKDALAAIDTFLTQVPGQLDALIQRAQVLQGLRRLDEAIAVAGMAVAFHPEVARARHVLGVTFLKDDQAAAAVAAFAEAVRLDPESIDTWINYGVAQKETGDLAGAEASYRRALEHAPDDPVVQNNLGNTLTAAGRTKEAVEHYRKAVLLDPAYADAKANMGVALRDGGDTEGALTFLAKAAQEHPDHAVLLNAYGNTLRQAERIGEAIEVLKQALDVFPGYAEAHNNIGLAYALDQKMNLAATHLHRAFELKPSEPVIGNNYGALMLRMFQFEKAIDALSNVVARDPEYDDALINLGVAHYMCGEADEAIAAYRSVLERNPDNGFARYSLGVSYLEDQRLEEAEVEIRRALELDPDNAMAHNTLGVLLLEQHYVSESLNEMRQAADVNTVSAPVFFSNYAFASLYSPDKSNEEIFEIHKEFGRRFTTSDPDPDKPHKNLRDPARKLRVGYLSPDFRAHSVSYFFEAIIASHDRSKYEIVLYSDTTRKDVVTDSMRAAADLWVESGGLTDDDLADRIESDGIDILINLGGHTSGNRLPMCALKPVPVQIEYLGYPETSGVPAMDFRISDGRADPEGEAEAWCTEKLVRLPRCFHCYRAGNAPDPAPAPHLKSGHVTFASFNVLPKVTEPAIEAWAEILNSVPGSRFFMKCKQLRDARAQDRVRADFARYGIAPERIEMAAFVASVKEHLGRYAKVDLALDTFPYNGTTTTCESLFMGVPVLTLRGRSHRGRVGLSLLHAMGLEEEFVADSVEDYVARAIAWGRDPVRLAEIRNELRPRMKNSPLRDEIGFTRDLESAYRDLWREWCDGPETFRFRTLPHLRPDDSIQGVLVKTL
jgi:protein O-GlcNAc transferase